MSDDIQTSDAPVLDPVADTTEESSETPTSPDAETQEVKTDSPEPSF